MRSMIEIRDDELFKDHPWSIRVRSVITREYGDDVLVGKMRRIKDAELLRLPNFGKVSLRELRSVLGPHLCILDTPTWITFMRVGLRCPMCNEVVAEADHGSKLFIPATCPTCGYPEVMGR